MSYPTEPTDKGINDVKEWLSSLIPKAEVKVDKYGVVWVDVPFEKIKDTISMLKDKGYSHLITISGVDLIKENKMALIYHLAPYEIKGYPLLCVRIYISREDPVAPSIVDIFKVALVYEREVYDLLGIRFDGHPNLSRILLPKDLPEGYHPLRKDFKEEGE